MMTPIPEAELMLSLPVEDWDWVLLLLSESLESCMHPCTQKHQLVLDALCVQFFRQKAALMSANKPEESRTEAAVDMA